MCYSKYLSSDDDYQPKEYWGEEDSDDDDDLAPQVQVNFEAEHQFPADDLPRPARRRRLPQGAGPSDISRHLDVGGVHMPRRPQVHRQHLDLSIPRAIQQRPMVGRVENLAMKDHEYEENRGVKYVRDLATLTAKYEVTLGPLLTRRNRVLDTAAVYGHYRQKRQDGSTHTADKPQLVGAVLGNMDGAERRAWSKSLIWVCVRGGGGGARFYSHVCKLDRFHHSSFTAGGDLVGAGQWIVKEGKLEKISAQSGHYLPKLTHLQQSVRLMSRAFHADTQVMLYDVVASAWTYVSAFRFCNEGSAGGRYKAHPQE